MKGHKNLAQIGGTGPSFLCIYSMNYTVLLKFEEVDQHLKDTFFFSFSLFYFLYPPMFPQNNKRRMKISAGSLVKAKVGPLVESNTPGSSKKTRVDFNDTVICSGFMEKTWKVYFIHKEKKVEQVSTQMPLLMLFLEIPGLQALMFVSTSVILKALSTSAT